ncbi:MAG: amidohydrolase family protein [Pseudomonadales bacterium]
MSDIFIRNAITISGHADIHVRGNRIHRIGLDLPNEAGGEEIDASGSLVWPGLVNTHHHLVQSLLKGVPSAIQSGLNEWLPLVPFAAWPHVTPDTVYTAARLGFAELLRSGCTTCADHHYLYDESALSMEREAALFQAAAECGIRFVLCRGGATQAGTHKGLAGSKHFTESLETWIDRLDETFRRHHDPAPDAMSRLVVAPTSIVHTSTPEALRELGNFARARGLRRHSHLLEVPYDEQMAQVQYGLSAADYAESVGWLGDDVWYAHLVHADTNAVARFGETRTGIAHCPVSNCRLGSGVAPLPGMLASGMQISLGVDGSASAESGSMVNELMQAWLVHRAIGGADATSPLEVMRWGTAGGADLLGLEAGRLAEGALADLVMFDIDQPRFMGLWMPTMAPVLCGEPIKAERVMVNGKWVIERGQVKGIDLADLAQSASRERQRLMERFA